jgi:hypothetical protein
MGMIRFGLCVFLACALALGGCGYGSNSSYGSNTVTPGTITYNETLNTGDTLNDQILRFELTISSITFTGMAGTTNTSNLLSQPARVEFVHQAEAFEPLALENVPAGTYSSATITVSNPNVVVLNAGVPSSVTTNLTSPTVITNFASAITVSSSSIATLNFDLDLAGSVTLNGSPVTSAAVNPVFNVTTTSIGASASQDVASGEVADLHGTLASVSNSGFTLQTGETSIPFQVAVTTTYGGYGGGSSSSQLSDLADGDIVEVDGTTNTDGTKFATAITKDASSTGEEVEGILTSVIGSPATGLTIADQLDSTGSSNQQTSVAVSVGTNTTFSVRPDKLNIVSMQTFDATHIGKGQRIEADSLSAGFPTIATSVKLREQAILGTVAATPAPTSSSFTLNLDSSSAFSTLSGVTSIAVTVANGATLKVTPMAGATLLVRGLIFVNGSTYTMIATRDE